MQIQKTHGQSSNSNPSVNFGSAIINKEDLKLVQKAFPHEFHALQHYFKRSLRLPAEVKEDLFQKIGADKVLILDKNEQKSLKKALPNRLRTHSDTKSEQLALKYGIDKMIDSFIERAKIVSDETIEGIKKLNVESDKLFKELG